MRELWNYDKACKIKELSWGQRQVLATAFAALPREGATMERLVDQALQNGAGCQWTTDWPLHIISVYATDLTLQAEIRVLETLLEASPADTRTQEELLEFLLGASTERIAYWNEILPDWAYHWRWFEGHIPRQDSRRPYPWSISLACKRICTDLAPESLAIQWAAMRFDLLRLIDDDLSRAHGNGAYTARQFDKYVRYAAEVWREMTAREDADLARRTVERIARDLAPALDASAKAALTR